MATKCDIIRDSAQAASCGMCRALAEGASIPSGCGDPAPKPSACQVPSTANTRMYLFAAQAAPPGFRAGGTRAEVLANYRADIAATEQALMDDYGVAQRTAAISWPDYERCLESPDGLPGGPLEHVYFNRADAEMQGLHPSYPLGGNLGGRLLWRGELRPGPIPLTVDYLMNPDLFTILVLVFLVLVLGGLVRRALRDERRAERAAARASAPDLDPGQRECRDYVESLEKEGYNMDYYRARCGL